MTNQVQVFDFENTEVKTIIHNGELLFDASQVSIILGFGNPRQALASHCSTEDVQKLDTLTKGGIQQKSYVNESGLYCLIFGSKKPQALAFKKWVTSVVLPTIRETGGYSINQNEYITPNERTKIMRLAASKALSIMHANDLPFKKDVNAGRFTFTTDTNTKSCLVSEIRAAICGHYSITGYLRLKTQDKKDVHAIIDEFVPLFIYYDDKSLIGYSDFMNSQLRMLQMGMFTHPSIKMQPSLFDDGVGQSYPLVESHKVLQVPPPPTQSPIDLDALVKQINDAQQAVKDLMAKAELQNA